MYLYVYVYSSFEGLLQKSRHIHKYILCLRFAFCVTYVHVKKFVIIIIHTCHACINMYSCTHMYTCIGISVVHTYILVC